MKIKISIFVSLVILVGLVIWSWPFDKLRVIFCNVGQGDGAIVILGNFQMLIDVGPENKMMVACLGRHVPFWDKTIEAVVITHPDSDHNGGLGQVREYYNVQKIYADELVKNDVIKYDKISFEVLNPESSGGNDNNDSVVGVLRVGPSTSSGLTSVLFMGDVTSDVEQRLIWRGVIKKLATGNEKLDVLKVSHHGSAEATSQELLAAVRPEEAIISVGINSFGHPTKLVLDRLENAGIRVRRTDVEGDVVITYR